MSPGATFERVYLALKERVKGGAFAPGAPLEPAPLATDLVASITPVRDALHRPAGERLVQTPRGDGFRMPIYTEAGLRDLYGWNARLIVLAAGALHPGQTFPAEAPEPEGAADATARLFGIVARLSGSAELVAAISGLNDRLHAIRLREPQRDDWRTELTAIEAALADGSRSDLRRLVIAYHKRRIAGVSRLLEDLQPSL